MDLTLSDSELAFQAEARAWLAAHVPAEPLASMDTADGFRAHQEWEARLADARWSVVSWPEGYHGRDASLVEWVIFEEEYHRAGAPGRVSQNGIFLLAPLIFDHGTPEQRDRFLPSMATGEQIWAQAWSEPEAGSDLASLTSTARRDEERGGWLLDGQKTWSSRASFAHWGFGLFRSDPEAARHQGLTYFLFPLDASGVTVRPIAQLDGETGFAEVFFEEVFVPDSDVLGAPGGGWAVAMSTAGNERGLSLRSPGRFCAAADRLVDLWWGLDTRAGARYSTTEEQGAGARYSTTEEQGPGARYSTPEAQRVADAWIKAQAYRLHTFGTVTRVAGGGELGAESSVTKVFWSDLDVALHQTALDLRGADGELTDSWTDGLLFALGGPIYAGTNEIQRNIIAERLLGLPREKAK
jgi:alkylation response protein AidB-like acyl-CoA dehydrogenase